MPAQGRHSTVRSHRRRRKHRLAVAPWITVTGIAALVLSSMTTGYVYLASSNCTGEPVRVDILAAPAVSNIVDTLARHWHTTEPTITDTAGTTRCVNINTIAKDSADVAHALTTDWDPRLSGPQPDVWIPESTTWVHEAAANPHAEAIIPHQLPSLARTTTVIAMPKPMADTLTTTAWAAHTPTWETFINALGSRANWEQYGKPEWGPFKIGMADPMKSTAALHALMAITDSNNDGHIDGAERQAIWAFKQSVTRSGIYTDSTEALLADLSNADTHGEHTVCNHVTGFPALERDILTYNATKPKVPLAAIYPEGGSTDADHPYVILNGMWKDPSKQDAARTFLTYLRGETGRTAFLNAGFRDPNRIAGQVITAAPELQTHIHTLPRTAPLPEAVKITHKSWIALARPINVLLLMDSSGATLAGVPTTRRNRLDLAKAATANAIGMAGTQAHAGLWKFSTNRDNSGDYETVYPISALEPDNRDNLIAHINSLTADGGKGLYSSTWAAYQELAKNYRSGAGNILVVITDGKDEANTGTLNLDTLLTNMQQAATSGKKIQVVTVGYGPDADLSALQRIAQATGGRALQSTTARDINDVMLDALFN
ncbi:MAG: substrate-binding domain-containing protein [Longispora sp.]|nr:substrate-binding domain-containing protein [Longispora sp. (in: high G+C Gram-positive bacteria)]